MGDGGGSVTTLNYKLQMLDLSSNHTIAKVMDTEMGICAVDLMRNGREVSQC